MNKQPAVSVITVFLNAEEFFSEAVGSVLAQTFTDWELLLVDDGSTDSSTRMALDYEARFADKVRYLEHDDHQNRGISASQNLGISRARGRYIAFLDADDVWFPHKLEQQVAILDSEPEAAIVYGYTRYWYGWTGKPEDEERDLIIEPGVETNSLISPPALLARFLLGEAPVPCPSDVMVRRSAAARVGGFEQSFRRIFTDQVFYAKLLLRESVFVSSESWFKYRKHNHSAVSVMKNSGQMRLARMNYLNWLEEYLSEQEVGDQEVWTALRKARWRCRHPLLHKMPDHAKYRMRKMSGLIKEAARKALPAPVHGWLRARWNSYR